jgi:hypothetical protein
MTKTPKSYLSEEERAGLMAEGGLNLVYLAESQEAGRVGDEEAAWEWPSLAKLPAHSLMSLKESEGAQFIRDMGFPTTHAYVAYGPNWLND